MIDLLGVFGFVFVFNLLPAFAPPTWMVLSYMEILLDTNPLVLALVGAVAATLGRFVLAKAASFVKERFMSDSSRENVEYLRNRLDKNRKFTFGAALFYAFSPLPSNHLFIAYGLTGLSLWIVTIPFFLGRLASYSFWAFTASRLDRMLAASNLNTGGFMTAYFFVTQGIFLILIYLFVKIDWQALIKEKKFKLIRNNKNRIS